MIRCIDRTTNVAYPWHDEYTGRGYCTRCGETTDPALHAAYLREQARQEADRRALDRYLRFEDGLEDRRRLGR